MEHSTAAVALQAFVGQADAQFHDLAQGLGQWVLASPRTLAEVEQHTLAAIKEVGQQVLAGACQLAVVATPTPPTTRCDCGQQADYQRQRPAQVRTVLGPITIPRAYYHCATCHRGLAPADRRPLPVNPAERKRFLESVVRAKAYIAAGDIIQVVPSRRVSVKTPAHPLEIYRALRRINPSPYMYFFRDGDTHVIGSSPEMLVRLEDGRAETRPIAGTRPRGATPAEDERLARELLRDPKERAEHLMLVDLARNDLGRVSKPGSVKVPDFMTVERYSHVMHIVSKVTSELAAGRDAFDLFRATFPAGTLSGAPKIRAMEIIEELEPTRRGLYGGAVGYFSYTGNMDVAIAIRTILLQKGMAHLQAGAGIVADSVPATEFEETQNKMAALVAALRLAGTKI